MESHALLLYIRMGVCKLCYAFHNSPRPRCSVLELAFSTTEMRSFSKANGRLSAPGTQVYSIYYLYILQQATAVITKL